MAFRRDMVRHRATPTLWMSLTEFPRVKHGNVATLKRWNDRGERQSALCASFASSDKCPYSYDSQLEHVNFGPLSGPTLILLYPSNYFRPVLHPFKQRAFGYFQDFLKTSISIHVSVKSSRAHLPRTFSHPLPQGASRSS